MQHANVAEDREKVLSCFGRNFVVEAGAGTGKTSALIRRICVAVVAYGVAVEKIVALTFTEKAAAEIKNRLVNAFHQIARDIREEEQGVAAPEQSSLHWLHTQFHLKNEEILARVQSALARLDRASVGTIHSFCADILKTFPLEAGLSPQAEIDAGVKATRLFNARWNSFLDQELGEQATRAALWKAVLSEISLDELKTFSQTLCSGQIEQYDYFSHADMLASICEEKSVQARTLSTAFLDPRKPSPRKLEQALTWAADSLQRSASFLRSKPTSIPRAELPAAVPSMPKGWDEQSFEIARGLVQFALKTQPEKQQVFCQALSLVKDLIRQIRSDYAHEGVLSFDDLIVKTRNLIQQDLYVRRLLKEKFDMLFIDEFQDTDPVQGELLLFLAEEKSSSAWRWQDVRLEPGKLFVVGDPKQSIYRFRGADITAYELFTQLILNQGGEKCFLRQNFRSTPQIVATANAVCSRAMIQQSAFQPAYEPIFADNSSSANSVRWMFITSPAQGAGADDFRANQAEQIANWIRENVGKLVLANGEKLTYKDIALLSRAATTAGPYTEALRRHGIPFNTDSEKDFFKRQEINDFINFLRVVADPADTIALTGVLRSPLGGFSDEEIYQIASRGELSVYAQTTNGALKRLYALLKSFIQKAGRLPVEQLVAEIMDTTCLPEVCAGAYEGEKTLEILTRFISLARAVTADKPISLGQFITTLQNMWQETPEILNSLGSQGADAVTVMTVHKSKGLEKPVVILVDLSRKETGGSGVPSVQHIFSWQYNMHGLRIGKICDVNLAFLEEEQKKHERCEEVRILYVALTRAREQLLLVADGRKGGDLTVRAFEAAGLWPDGQSQLVGGDEVQIPVSYYSYQSPEQFLYRQVQGVSSPLLPQGLTQWQSAYQKRKTRYETLSAQRRLSPSRQVEEGPLSPQQQAGAELGSVCHRALELLWSVPNISVGQAVQQAALDHGLTTREEEALAVIEPFTKSALFAQLKQEQLLASEMPFSYVTSQGEVESGVMDAIFQRADGSIWVVDYKTDQVGSSGLTPLLEKYRPQLTTYGHAARRLFEGKEIKCSVVFLRAFAALDL